MSKHIPSQYRISHSYSTSRTCQPDGPFKPEKVEYAATVDETYDVQDEKHFAELLKLAKEKKANLINHVEKTVKMMIQRKYDEWGEVDPKTGIDPEDKSAKRRINAELDRIPEEDRKYMQAQETRRAAYENKQIHETEPFEVQSPYDQTQEEEPQLIKS